MIDLFSLAGRTALVTGGARGIGAAVTAELLRAGARVIVVARSSVGLDAAVAELVALGPVGAVVGDLSTLRGVQELIAQVARRTDRLDVLVIAETAPGDSLEDRTEVGWDTVLDPGVRTRRYLTVAALPLLRAAAAPGDPARVINIGPLDGPLDGLAAPEREDAYAARRAAMGTLTRQHAERLAGEFILVNAIAPRESSAAEVGGRAVYLASGAGAHTTGTVMVVGGVATGRGRADALLG